MGISLNDDQLLATYQLEEWFKSERSQLIEVEGPAGTGKTTMILYFIQHIGLKLSDVLFVSYMGKAVSQMIRNGLPAKTIHAVCYDYEKVPMYDDNGRIIMRNGYPKMRIMPKLKKKLDKKVKLIIVDEAYTVPEQNALDLLSFGVPTIALGDSHQLPPPFGSPLFLRHPEAIEVRLHTIMRQSEDSPIIRLSQMVLNRDALTSGYYGQNCGVVRFEDMNPLMLQEADVIITASNALRYKVNEIFREKFMGITELEIPHYREKVICRRNNWDMSLKDNGARFYLTNGTMGTVEYIDKKTYNGKTVTIDFKPDFMEDHAYRNLKVDAPRLSRVDIENSSGGYVKDLNIFEYAYALTAYTAQGSQWPGVIVFDEDIQRESDKHMKLMYSAITRARSWVKIVLPPKATY